MSESENSPEPEIAPVYPDVLELLGMPEVPKGLEADARRERQARDFVEVEIEPLQLAAPDRYTPPKKAPIVVREPGVDPALAAEAAGRPKRKAPAKKKAARVKLPALETWEVSLVKAMVATERYSDQDILAYFTRPTRTVNHRVISEIRNKKRSPEVPAADQDTLDQFFAIWPDVNPDTGLSVRGDELLIKAREAMIAAVHVFNSAGLTFRAELFIVSSIIAWTYLLHSWFKRQGISYKYSNKKTKGGGDAYWDLSACLAEPKCPISPGAKTNLEFLIQLRNEIEHQSTSRIDDAVGAKLQSCCLNFNEELKKHFGNQYGLEKRLPIALQFVSFGDDQREILKKARSLPAHVSTFIDAFDHGLTKEQLDDPAYCMKVAFVPVSSNKPGTADVAVEFVKPGSEGAKQVERVLLKEVQKTRYTAAAVIKKVQGAGWPLFTDQAHRDLWKKVKAKDPAKGFGCKGDYKGSWVWLDTWVGYVLDHCKAYSHLYRPAPKGAGGA
ncbi:MAG: hypothetical protein JG765_5 [Cereibacter sp.]|jgi:hypothetical protein|nr:hypothetical protein [Cereibacter sp.]